MYSVKTVKTKHKLIQRLNKHIRMEEDTEFRDLIIKKLENNGVLLKIKAALRAQIHNLVETDNKTDDSQNASLANDSTCDSYDDATNVALSLIQDLLDCFNLDVTKSVFKSESGEKVKYVCKTRADLLEQLQISEDDDGSDQMSSLISSKVPVLIKYLTKNCLLSKANVNETFAIAESTNDSIE